MRQVTLTAARCSNSRGKGYGYPEGCRIETIVAIKHKYHSWQKFKSSWLSSSCRCSESLLSWLWAGPENMVIRCSSDGHRPTMRPAGLDISEQCASSVWTEETAACVWRFVDLPALYSFRIMASLSLGTLPSTRGYASPEGWWTYIVLNHVVLRKFWTSIETNVVFPLSCPNIQH